jgi:hypothetical protein
VKGDAHYLQFWPLGFAGRQSPAATFRLGLLALACAGLAACGGSASIRSGGGSQAFGLGDDGYAEATPLSVRSNEVLMRAIGLVGTPYRYGGNTPEAGFDCSGLVGFVFRDAAGLALPRSTRELIDIPAREISATNCSRATSSTSTPPAAASATSASTWARAASCTPPAAAARCAWTRSATSTGTATSSAPSASCNSAVAGATQVAKKPEADDGNDAPEAACPVPA